MRVISQNLGELLGSLRPLTVEWQDDVARRVVERLKSLPIQLVYTEVDVQAILENGLGPKRLTSKAFDEGLLIVRLFLGLSKDQFSAVLADALGPGGSGLKRYQQDPAFFLACLTDLGLLDAMGAEATRQLHWSDTLVERLRSGRGSAISGQKRGRGAEDFVEDIIRGVFGDQFEPRVTFTGREGRRAKCDFAIPSKESPRILIESKGYGATGSKMTDVVGDIEKIIGARRVDSTFLFFTDGLTWKQRQSDLRKIIHYQNIGDIARVYTHAMADQFEADLRTLKAEYDI
ncbi:MAG TPA: DpnII family type II restriction endonuclease [Rhodopila sp.]|nr:DpnII family type II restriction endonuclease [Rhodopila sp.]